jgi:hypothetical protein
MRTTIAAFALVAAVAAPALAGFRVFQPLHMTVNSDGSGFAIGNMADTRANGDSVSYIGCMDFATPTSTVGICEARDNLGHSVRCHTTGPDMLRAVAMINATSRIQLAWDSTSSCTMLQVENMSYTAPVAP